MSLAARRTPAPAAATAPATARAPAENVAAATLWMTGAIAAFSVMAVAGREMAADLDTFEIMAWRSLLGLALVAGFGLAAGRLGEIRTARPGAHLCRNALHFAGQNLWLLSLTMIPLAQVFALEFTTPIWVALLAPLMLGERLTRARLAAAVLGLLGVLLVARPGAAELGAGHLAILAAAVCFAGNVIATKALSRTETVWTILFWMTATQAAMGAAAALADGAMALPPAGQLGWLAAIAIGGLVAHLSIASALAAAPATVVAPLDFLRLPVIAGLGAALYGEPFEIAVLAGGAAILAGNILNIRAEGRA